MIEITGYSCDIAYIIVRVAVAVYMRSTSLTTKLISVVLAGLVCLNGGGALCLAFCRSGMETEHTAHGKPTSKKGSVHCDRAAAANNGKAAVKAGGHGVIFCPMTTGFVAGPVEKNPFSQQSPSTAIVTSIDLAGSIHSARIKVNIPTPYRGPPLDRRNSRLMNGVIRI